jgi:hypothetical protein
VNARELVEEVFRDPALTLKFASPRREEKQPDGSRSQRHGSVRICPSQPHDDK